MRSRTLLLGAAAVGLVHAAVSLSWALGSPWLLDTVGSWATEWSERSPATAAAALAAIALVKAAGAIVPLLVDRGRLPARRVWRALSWTGAVVLAGYGLANTVGAWLVLTGVVAQTGPPDEAALLGHALLWDPLFALWGALLAAGLWRGRARATTPEPSCPPGRVTAAAREE